MNKVNMDDFECAAICGLKETAGVDNPFHDNMEGVCLGCDRAIIFRPTTPHGLKVAMFCVECGLEVMEQERANGVEIEPVMLKEQVPEITKLLGHNAGHAFAKDAMKEDPNA